MKSINKAIGEYQDIIGSYDKHQWERSFDQAVIKGLNTITRKRGKVNKNFIDVDIVRGSAFSKSKQRLNIFSISLRALIRLIFMPFYWKWWCGIGGKNISSILLILYILHCCAFCVYFTAGNSAAEVLFASQLITPCLLMFVISLVHSQVLASSPNPTHINSPSSNSLLCQESMEDGLVVSNIPEVGGESGRESSGSHDTGIDVTQAGISDSNAENRGPANPVVQDSVSDESSNQGLEELNEAITTQLNQGSIDITTDSIKGRSHSPMKTVQSQNKIKYIRRTKAWLQEVSREATPVNSLFVATSSPQRFASTDRVTMEANHKGRRTISESSFDETEVQIRTAMGDNDRLGTSNSSLNSQDVHDESFSNLEDFSMLVTTVTTPPTHQDNSSESSYDDENKVTRSQKIMPRNLPVLRRRKSVNKFEERDLSRTNKDHLLLKKRIATTRGEKMNDADEEDEVTIDTKRSRSLKKVCFDESGSANLITVTPYESASELSMNEGEELEDSNCRSNNIQLQKATKIMKNLNANSTKISCMIFEDNDLHKVELTVLDIGWSIIRKVEKSSMSCDYFLVGFFFTLCISATPLMFHLFQNWTQFEMIVHSPTNYTAVADLVITTMCCNWRNVYIAGNGVLQRFGLSIIIFFLLSVSERTFYQRLLYAKNFCCLTSLRRSRKYDLPHFRLNKVNNIRTWLLLRSFLKKRGPQRSVETLVSSAFLAAVVIVSLICIEMLKEQGSFMDSLGNWELVVWGLAIGIYLLRFITLGTRIKKEKSTD